MLIPPRELAKLGVTPTGIVHVGAHTCEEADLYRRQGWDADGIWWFEANPTLTTGNVRRLSRYRNQHYHGGIAVTDQDEGTVTLNVTNNVQSSSLLPLGTHAVVSPDVHYVDKIEVPQRTLDSLVVEHGIRADFLNADVQGMEGAVLRGGEKWLLTWCKWAYLEANFESLYEGCSLFHDLAAWMFDHGFTIRALKTAGEAGWGDVLFHRTPARAL